MYDQNYGLMGLLGNMIDKSILDPFSGHVKIVGHMKVILKRAFTY